VSIIQRVCVNAPDDPLLPTLAVFFVQGPICLNGSIRPNGPLLRGEPQPTYMRHSGTIQGSGTAAETAVAEAPREIYAIYAMARRCPPLVGQW
jgi:hypothetical protein